MPAGGLPVKITAAATTGPAHGPLPASSTPAISPPYLRSSARSGRRVGFGDGGWGGIAPSLNAMRMQSSAGNAIPAFFQSFKNRWLPPLEASKQAQLRWALRLEKIGSQAQMAPVQSTAFECKRETRRDLLGIGAGASLPLA